MQRAKFWAKNPGLNRATMGLALFVGMSGVAGSAIGQVFQAYPDAATGQPASGTGRGSYGVYGLNASVTNPAADSYEIWRKYSNNNGESDLPVATNVPGNPTAVEWTETAHGGECFCDAGMHIGNSRSTRSYPGQVVYFGDLFVQEGSEDQGTYEARFGFFEKPQDWKTNVSPNSENVDLWAADMFTDAVYLLGNFGGNDPNGRVARTNTQGLVLYSGDSSVQENQRDNRADITTRTRAGSGAEITESLGTFVDAGVDFGSPLEVGWWMELNDPSNSDPILARQVKINMKMGNVITSSVFDPGAPGSPPADPPNQADPQNFTDGYFDWQNATPVFFVLAGSSKGSSNIMGVFRPGDFNADGTTNTADLTDWNANKFQQETTYSRGDGNQDGNSDVEDLVFWNGNRGTGAPGEVQFVYDPATGQLRASGAAVTMYSLDIAPASVTNASGSGLPSGWSSQVFDGALQAYDTSVLTNPANPIGNTSVVVAQLASGLAPSAFGEILYGTQTGSGASRVVIGGRRGDLNGDGAVDAADAAVMFGGWGAQGGRTVSDINGDGAVDAADAGILFASWTGDAKPSMVPEPASSAMILGMVAACSAVRRRQAR